MNAPLLNSVLSPKTISSANQLLIHSFKNFLMRMLQPETLYIASPLQTTKDFFPVKTFAYK